MTKTETKYLDVLNEVYELSADRWVQTKLLYHIFREYQCDTSVLRVMQKQKIVTGRNPSSRGFSEYKWNSIKPNLLMTKKIIDLRRKQELKKRRKKKEMEKLSHPEQDLSQMWQELKADKVPKTKEREAPNKSDKETLKSTKKVSILWGLYSYEKSL